MYACVNVCVCVCTCVWTSILLSIDSSILCPSPFFSIGCLHNRLKWKTPFPQRQVISPAEKADPYAVGFCLNGIVFLNSVHRNSFLSPLKTKDFAHLETPPVFMVPSSTSLGTRTSFCRSTILSEKAALTPNSQNQTLQRETQARLPWCLGLDPMNC